MKDASRRKGRYKLNVNQRRRLKRTVTWSKKASLRGLRDAFNEKFNKLGEHVNVSYKTIGNYTNGDFYLVSQLPLARQQSEKSTLDRVAFGRSRLAHRRTISVDSSDFTRNNLVECINAHPARVPRSQVPVGLALARPHHDHSFHYNGAIHDGRHPLSELIFVPLKRKQQYVHAGICQREAAGEQPAFASEHMAPALAEIKRFAASNGLWQGQYKVLLDGATQHSSRKGKQLIEAAGIELVNLPSAQPGSEPDRAGVALAQARIDADGRGGGCAHHSSSHAAPDHQGTAQPDR
jgi:hypothetical protein